MIETPTVTAAPREHLVMHRHPEPRLVLFLDGLTHETTFGGAQTFSTGEFVFRPAFFAHDDVAGRTGAAYTRLPLSASAVRRWVSRHGWRAGRGRVNVGLGLCGDELLEAASTEAYAPTRPASRLHCAADWLTREPEIRARDAAERLSLEPFEFSRRFNAAFGLTPTEYRRQARLQRAIGLLCEDEGSLAHVAASAGFHDQSHLCSELRREIGCTPAALRAALTNG